MPGAQVSTIQLELTILPLVIHVICLSAGFKVSISLSGTIPECS